ncbi:TrbI/VirB10 family protein [Microbulbifer aggregans]|uniref:TrbI/VirB10 family protein n=1 Tax=Microbulbifer aggregans TaxID=1769779 RepID=UPI001CFF209D|nr:TrbI/VirB10 family protein [Microbulbifer aggregans]
MSEAALDIRATPNSLGSLPKPKRLGKLPMMLIASAVVLFVVLLLVVMASRQAQIDNKNAATIEPEERKASDVVSSRVSVQEILADAPSGTIPEYTPEATRKLGEGSVLIRGEAHSATNEVSLAQESVPVNFQTTGLAAGQGGQGSLASGVRPLEQSAGQLRPLTEQEAERIQQMVNQRMESALFAPTTVQFNAQSMQNQLQGGQSGSQASVDPNRDVMSLYQQRMAEIDAARQALGGGNGNGGYPGGLANAAGMPGVSPASTGGRGGFGPQPTGDWDLGAERVPGQAFTLKSGGMIPAVMISGINSDLPGQVIAQVSQNVYDTATGHDLLVPQGTRLFGRYGSDNQVGDTRVAVKWDRLIFPDGSTLDLKEMNGSDQEGYSGFKDQVNNHYFKIFGGAALLSLISAGYQIALGDDDDNRSGYSQDGLSAKEQISIQMAQQMNQVGSELIRRNMRIQPSIVIRPGYKFMIMVNKDITFRTPYMPMALTQQAPDGYWK